MEIMLVDVAQISFGAEKSLISYRAALLLPHLVSSNDAVELVLKLTFKFLSSLGVCLH